MKIMNCTELYLKGFLVRAKRNTYAGDGALSTSSRPNSKDLHYREGDLLYIDSYFGSYDFIGEEVVFENQKPIWGMNYYGKMLVDEIPSGFITCLKSALKQVTAENPFRGPNLFEKDKFIYKCFWNGDISWFSGNEVIYFNGVEIYRLSFQGGFIS